MPVSPVLGSFIGLKPGNTRRKAPHLSTKRIVGTTRAIAKPTVVAPTLIGSQFLFIGNPFLVPPASSYNEPQF
jgi:hypothetical protein